jgi:hypothetical protein
MKNTGRKTDKINLGPGHETEREKLYFYFGEKAFYFVYILCIFSSHCNKHFAYIVVLWEGKNIKKVDSHRVHSIFLSHFLSNVCSHNVM